MTRARKGALSLPIVWALSWVVPAGSSSGCGARTALRVDDAGPDVALVDDEPADAGLDAAHDADAKADAADAKPPVECETDADCSDTPDLCNPVACVESKCVPQVPKSCDDKDPCTKDTCVPATGACKHAPLSFDLDGDGHKGPAPGKKVGDPDACGDDCDDTSAAAFPGNKEICDGVDNDCNGVVDDDAKYVAVGGPPVQVSQPDLKNGEAGGLAFSASAKTGYLTAYTGETSDNTNIYVRTLDATGAPSSEPKAANLTTGDAYGGPLVWTGDRYGLAWQDRRDGDYEIYFNTFGPDGAKLGPDIRVTDAPGFSINPTLAWAAGSFYLLWQDARNDPSSQSFQIYARQLGLDGQPVGPELVVTDEDSAEAPSVAASSQGVAVAYRTGDSKQGLVKLRTLSLDLSGASSPVTLAEGDKNYESPQAVWNGSSYVVTFNQKQPFKVFGVGVSTQGAMLIPTTELSPPGGQNRGAGVLPLGDRVIVVYSRQSPDGYDLFTRTFSKGLVPLSDPQQITSAVGDDFLASVTFGPSGDVGVFYTGRVAAAPSGLKKAAFFTRLQCTAGK